MPPCQLKLPLKMRDQRTNHLHESLHQDLPQRYQRVKKIKANVSAPLHYSRLTDWTYLNIRMT